MALISSKRIFEYVVEMLSTITYPASPQSTERYGVEIELETGDEVGASITKQNQAAAREETDSTRPVSPRIGIRVADLPDLDNTQSYGRTYLDNGPNTLIGLSPLPMLCAFTLKVYSRTNYQLFPIWAALQFKMHPTIPLLIKDDETGEDLYLRKLDVRRRIKTAPFSAVESPQSILDFSVPFWQITTEKPETVIRHEEFLLDPTDVIII